MGLEPTNLLTASQALYQLSYAPEVEGSGYQPPPVARLGLEQLARGAAHRR
jgi:hypothetical protein